MRRDLKTAEIMAFVKNAVYLAKEKGTINELENYCGLSPGYFSRRCNGTQSALSLQLALLVCEYLGRSVEELIDPKLKQDLEAKRIQQKLEEVERAKLSLSGGE